MRVTLIFLTLLGGATVALAHGWYDNECCNDYDCAPVTNIEYLPDNSWKITTTQGTAVFPPNFPRRPSKDGKYHACFTPSKLYCLYAPPEV